MNSVAPPATAGSALGRLLQSRLVRQNLVLFIGGLVGGIGGFVYHAIAGRVLGPSLYGDVATLVAIYAVGGVGNLILILVIARYTATLETQGRTGGVRYVVTRTTILLALPAVVWIGLTLLAAGPVASFERLHSSTPVIWLGIGIAAFWYAAVPRGVLQGTQHFTALSANLSLEMVARTSLLYAFLKIGFAVTGAMVAVLLGLVLAWGLGMATLRPVMSARGEPVPLRSMAGFALTAAAGTLGVLLLYNLDVILAKHYLGGHDAGIYGSLNKIGTIVYFLTLSVSQVLFPRVVEAVAKNSHPVRLLVMSAGLLCLLGGGALLVFGVLPHVVVNVLFAAQFRDAEPFVFPIGVVGLALSLVNLLVQFLMAVHDRVFVPILAAGVMALAILIAVNHGGVGAVVADAVITNLALLAVLTVRVALLAPRLRPEMVAEE